MQYLHPQKTSNAELCIFVCVIQTTCWTNSRIPGNSRCLNAMWRHCNAQGLPFLNCLVYTVKRVVVVGVGLSQPAWSLQWRHNGRDDISNHQPYDCLLNRLFRRRSKKTSKLRVTGLCVGNSPVTGEFPTQRVSNAENISILWRHHGT